MADEQMSGCLKFISPGDVILSGLFVLHSKAISTMRVLLLLTIMLLPLAGCDRLGIPDPAKEAAAREDDAKAIGGACRQSGRALEDCFTLNPNANKASVFNGWKDMNDYMTQNKIETVKPEFPVPGMLSPKRHPGTGESDPTAEQSAPAEEMTVEERRAARAARKQRALESRDAARKK